jgi:hypothetical protein
VISNASYVGRILCQQPRVVKIFFLPIDHMVMQGYYQLALPLTIEQTLFRRPDTTKILTLRRSQTNEFEYLSEILNLG